MVIDVGVLFEGTGASPVQAISMVIPARVVKQIDLHRKVVDSSNAKLIFGRTFESTDGSALTLSGLGAVPVVRVGEVKVAKELETIVSRGPLTALRVVIHGAPEPGRKAYLRVRFVVDSTTDMFRWHRVLFRRSGALIDLRVHDPREGSSARDSPLAAIVGKDKEVEKLDAFYMLPERFQITSQNPALEYTRTLEPGRWKSYLRRSAEGAFRREHILVHRWKSREPINDQNPFRGYMQFQRVPNFRPLTDTLLLVILVCAALYGLFGQFEFRPGPGDALDAVTKILGSELAAGIDIWFAGGVGIVAALGLITRVTRTRAAIRVGKRAFKELEFHWFKILGRS